MTVQHTDWQCGAICADGKPCTVPLVDWGGSHESWGPCDSTPVDPTTCPCEDCRDALLALNTTSSATPPSKPSGEEP